jgi:hypothetical protein
LTPAERTERIGRSPFQGKYEQSVDRESAYEKLKARADQTPPPAAVPKAAAHAEREVAPRAGHARQTTTEAMFSSAARAIGSSLGRQLIRGILGSLRK